jgi:hypothetical protein
MMRQGVLAGLLLLAACKKDPAPPSDVHLPADMVGAYDRDPAAAEGMQWISPLVGRDVTNRLIGSQTSDELMLIAGTGDARTIRVTDARVTRREDAFIDMYYDRVVARCDGTVTFADRAAVIALDGPAACTLWNGRYSLPPLPAADRTPEPPDDRPARADACARYEQCVCGLRDTEPFGKQCAEVQRLRTTAEEDPEACELGITMLAKHVALLGKSLPSACQ